MHWLLLAIALGLLALTNWRLRHLDPWHLRTQFVYRAEDFQAINASWSKQGQLGAYRRFVAIDFITLVSYGAFGYLWVAATPQFAVFVGWRQMIALLLPAAAVVDACENMLHLGFTSSAASAFPRAAYPVAGTLSAVKFLAIAVFALATSYALAHGAG
jgi:hypothetical protein